MRAARSLACAGALCAGLAAGAVGAASATGQPGAGGADGVAALSASLVGDLSASGLIGRGEPVAAFAWTLEHRRPLRASRRVHERYAGTPQGAPAGLSPVLRETVGPKPNPARAGISVRGLTVVHANDTGLDVRVEGLVLPLESGARFRLAYDEDGSSLAQECVVGGLAPATSVHPAIPGNARTIDCSGKGSYHGIPVGVAARVVYLVGLGVFVNLEQRIDSPFGPLRAGTRVLSFEAGKR